MLNFSPLSWVYHDNWQFKETILTKNQKGELIPVITTYDHAGHVHFFMTDYNTLKNARQQAYSGSQEYSFAIEDVWGPNSSDPNQTRSYKLIGKPRWYFYIEEYWRRVYIQPWEQEDYENHHPNHPEKIGIKYDASKPEHSFGPFREGGGFFFFDTEINRTLPVEYWLDEEKTKREHWLRKQHYSWDETAGTQVWNYEKNKRQWSRRGRGWWYYYWEGDNAIYEYDEEYGYEEYAGFNKPGDIVCVGSGKDKKFYKNTFIPSRPTATYGENYYPNPTPGGDIETLRNDFLTYYDFESEWGDKYTKEYSSWLKENKKNGTDADFRQFIDLKMEEFQENCFSSICPNCYSQDSIYVYRNESNEIVGECWNCGHTSFINEFHNYQNLKYEFIDFDAYCAIWEELSREEIIKLGLLGDYPLQKINMPIPEEKAEFGDEEDPFHKNGAEINPYEVYKKYFENREEYTIPRGREAKGDLPGEGHPRETSFTDEDGARRFYPDSMYIHPVIEYQKVIHLDYERLPERLAAESNIDIWTDTSNNFGDGFSVNISIPFRVNGVIQSPFSDDAGTVYPPGNYFHNFKDEKKLRYALESYGDPLELEAKEEDVNKALEVVQKYRRSEYLRFMKTGPDLIGKINWFNDNYANRPILMNDEEGTFDSEGNWIEVVTHDRPRREHVVIDENEKPTMESKPVQFSNPGFKEDGLWVEQCLGAKVIPKVELVLEDALGHRFTRWVDSIEASSGESFIGTSK